MLTMYMYVYAYYINASCVGVICYVNFSYLIN